MVKSNSSIPVFLLLTEMLSLKLRPALLLPFSSSSSSSSSSARASTIRISNLLTLRTNMSESTETMPTTATTTTVADTTAPDAAAGPVVVQYVVLRRDLIDTWPLGSIVTQGCHASVAAVWAHRHHPDTAAYVSDSNIDSMHKVTLEVKGEVQLRNLSEKLEAGGIEHKLWMEQPENIPTCIATRPYPKSQVASFFKKLKLCK